MPYEDQLIAIEDLAEKDLAAATVAAAALPFDGPQQAAERALLLGSLTARGGDLDAAIAHLAAAADAAQRAAQPVLEAEARITLASVHAALGDYDTAVPMLRAQIQGLDGLPGADALRRDAQAELEAYETLLGQ